MEKLELITKWYIREIKSDIPQDIISLIVSFMNKYKCWNFDRNSLTMIRFLDKLECTKELNTLHLTGGYECDHNIKFRCFLSKYPRKSMEYIQFVIELMSYPSHYSGIHIYYELCCIQTHSEYKSVKVMKHVGNIAKWDIHTLPISKCKQPHIAQLTFAVYIKVQFVSTDTSSKLWSIPLTMHNYCEYKWRLNHKQLTDLKAIDNHKGIKYVTYYSDVFGAVEDINNESEKCWMLSCYYHHQKRYLQLRLINVKTIGNRHFNFGPVHCDAMISIENKLGKERVVNRMRVLDNYWYGVRVCGNPRKILNISLPTFFAEKWSLTDLKHIRFEVKLRLSQLEKKKKRLNLV